MLNHDHMQNVPSRMPPGPGTGVTDTWEPLVTGPCDLSYGTGKAELVIHCLMSEYVKLASCDEYEGLLTLLHCNE